MAHLRRSPSLRSPMRLPMGERGHMSPQDILKEAREFASAHSTPQRPRPLSRDDARTPSWEPLTRSPPPMPGGRLQLQPIGVARTDSRLGSRPRRGSAGCGSRSAPVTRGDDVAELTGMEPQTPQTPSLTPALTPAHTPAQHEERSETPRRFAPEPREDRDRDKARRRKHERPSSRQERQSRPASREPELVSPERPRIPRMPRKEREALDRSSQELQEMERMLDLGSHDLWDAEEDAQHESAPSAPAVPAATATCGRNGVTALFVAAPSAAPSSGAAIKGSFTWIKGEMLGRGSLGSVFRALDQRTGQMLAVKEVVIDKNDDNDLRFMKALANEISIAQALQHPHIVSYLGHDLIDSRIYIYLEYMPGGSIAQVLSQFGPLDESLIRIYTRGLLGGLEYMHSRSPPVLHRDIKGANILVGMDCRVKLADFGCSKRQADTLSFTTKGSIPWMAPEVIQQTGYGRMADIWSFGCVIIEMASGAHPWGTFDNPMAAMVRIGMTEELPPLPPGLSKDCIDFITRCLQRDATKRSCAKDLLDHAFVQPA